MSILSRKLVAGLVVGVTALVLSACSSTPMFGSSNVTLTGANEVPSTPSTATGTSTIAVAADGTVTGSVTVTGMAPTAGHIHQAAPGVNGPVIVPFVQNGNTFSPAPFAKLNEAQMAAFRAGNLYVNVHSAAFPNGEIRGQLKGS